MRQPWKTLERVETANGPLELRQRGDSEFLFTVAGQVLMTSRATRSEEALAALACAGVAGKERPALLIGGLGLGFTLRAALDVLPPGAQVCTAELHDAVVRWCRGPLAGLSDHALDDPRVEARVADVSAVIAEARDRWDAIAIDLYDGPHRGNQGAQDPIYGTPALRRTLAALCPGGTFAVWAEEHDDRFAGRLTAAGFRDVSEKHPGRGSQRHVVYVARRGRRATTR
ncbi:MAG: spermidine synthase [Myxococcota bacterium]|jgi:spermidine synthase|nr:spermidine synthase [Myxococcota bacterium]